MTAKTANHRVVPSSAGAPNTLLLATCNGTLADTASIQMYSFAELGLSSGNV